MPSSSPTAPISGPLSAVPRVLVLDDQEEVRAAIGRVLRSSGYEVDYAGDGSEALARLESGEFGALLCDVRLPGVSGLDVLTEARRRDPSLAVVMISGAEDVVTVASAFRSGASDYLTKPVERSTLVAALRRAVEERAASRPSSQALRAEDVAGLLRHQMGLLERCIATTERLADSVVPSAAAALQAEPPQALSAAVSEPVALPAAATVPVVILPPRRRRRAHPIRSLLARLGVIQDDARR